MLLSWAGVAAEMGLDPSNPYLAYDNPYSCHLHMPMILRAKGKSPLVPQIQSLSNTNKE